MTVWMKHGLRLLWVAALAVGAVASAEDGKKALPDGWFITESAPQLYEAGVDTEAPCEGNRSAYLRSRPGASEGYGTFMQAFGAGAFRGKRLRFSAAVRTEGVKGWAGLWMRVEGEDARETLAFDNMQSRALVGTTGCKRYDVVLDVPRDARAIMAGLLLSGTGRAWLGAVRFEPVDTSVPVTDLLGSRTQRSDVPSGRVGSAWFNRGQVEGSGYRSLPQADGSWKDNFSESLSVEGNMVKGTFAHQPVNLTVTTGDTATLITGQMGTEPVSIELNPEKLVMKWGIHARNMVRENERVPEDHTCVRYRAGDGYMWSDVLDVCGEARGKKPPLVPLVISFLANGFRPLAATAPPALPPMPPPDRISRPGK